MQAVDFCGGVSRDDSCFSREADRRLISPVYCDRNYEEEKVHRGGNREDRESYFFTAIVTDYGCEHNCG